MCRRAFIKQSDTYAAIKLISSEFGKIYLCCCQPWALGGQGLTKGAGRGF
jgi:hypothetical protein